VNASGGCSRCDLLGGWWALLLWWLPAALILVGTLSSSLRPQLWVPSFAIMGIACLVNARGCGRVHCFVTGPLFLAASLASALDALSIVSISWRLVFVGAGAGTLLAYGLEWLRGRYIGTTV